MTPPGQRDSGAGSPSDAGRTPEGRGLDPDGRDADAAEPGAPESSGPLGPEPPPSSWGGPAAGAGRIPEGGRRAADGGWHGSRRVTDTRIRGEITARQLAAGAGGDPAWARDPGRRRRGGWARGPWAAGGGRPAWWPDDERWPPGGHRPWRGFGCFFGGLFVAGVIGLLSLGTTVVGHVLSAPGPGGALIRLASVVVAVAILVGLARAARAIRRTSTILDALVDQAARVEAGDYGARVEHSGRAPAAVEQLTRGFNTMAARLETDEAQRRSLLADVTHELRTPLAVVRGSVEAILDGIHPADEAHLAAILEETRVLDRLIEDLRTLALSESGSLSLHREPTDLAVLVGEVATSFGAAAAEAGTDLALAVEDDLPLVDVDPVRIREVIANVVSNALRHTPGGGRITIRAARGPSDAAAAGGTVEIAVEDTGPGIPPDLLPRVFERFTRGPASAGSGLGLSIARGLVELHGGSIVAASPAGGGAEIRVVLPIDRPTT